MDILITWLDDSDIVIDISEFKTKPPVGATQGTITIDGVVMEQFDSELH